MYVKHFVIMYNELIVLKCCIPTLVYFLKFRNFFFSVSWQLHSFCFHVSYLYKHLYLYHIGQRHPEIVRLSSWLDTRVIPMEWTSEIH